MATQTYSYLNTDGTVQTVDVTDAQGSCNLVSTRRGTRGTGTRDIDPYQKVITFSMSPAIAVPLDVYMDVETQVIRPGNSLYELEENKTVKFTIPRATESHEITVICRRDYTNNDEAITRTYAHTLLIQPETPEPDEEHKPFIPTETPFGDAPVFFLDGIQTMPNYVHGGISADIRIEIFKRGGAANSKEIEVYQRNPLTIRGANEDEQNIFLPVRGSGAELNLFGFIEDEFRQLFEEPDGNLRLDYYIGGTLFWQGYNISDQYTEQYYKPPYSIISRWSDGLGLLREEPFTTTSTRISIHDIIAEIWAKLGTTLHTLDAIYTYPAEAEMNTKRSPWEGVEVDCRVYQDNNGPFSCRQVLEELLKPFGANLRLGHYGGKAYWVIEEPGAALAGLSYREYSEKMNYVEVKKRPATIKVDSPNVNFAPFQVNAASSYKKARKVINKVELTKKLEFIPDLVQGGEFAANDFSYTQSRDKTDVLKDWDKNGDFDIKRVSLGGQKTTTGRSGVGVVNANYGLSIPANLPTTLVSVDGSDNLQDPAIATHFEFDKWLKSPAVSVKTEGGNYFDLEIYYRFKIDNASLENYVNTFAGEIYHMQLPVRIRVGDKYLNESRTWVDTPVTLLLPAIRYNQFYIFEERDLIIPEDGDFEVYIYEPTKPVTEDFVETENLLQNTTARCEIDYIRGIYKPSGDFASNEEIIIGEIETNANRSSPYKLEVLHADVNTLQNLSALTYNGELTTLWGTYYGNKAQTTELARLLIQKILNVYSENDKWLLQDFEVIPTSNSDMTPARTVTIGKFSEETIEYRRTRGRTRYVIPEQRFYCTSYTYSSYHARWSFVWVQLANSNVSVTYSYRDSKVSSSSGGGLVPSGAIGQRQTAEPSFDIRDYALVTQEVENSVSVYYDRSLGRLVVDLDDFDIGSEQGYALSEVKYQDDKLVFVTPGKPEVSLSLLNTLDTRYGVQDYVSESQGGTFQAPLAVDGTFTVVTGSSNYKVRSSADNSNSETNWLNGASTKVKITTTDDQSYFTTLAVGKTSNSQVAFEVQNGAYIDSLEAQTYKFGIVPAETKMLAVNNQGIFVLQDVPEGGESYSVASNTNLGLIKVNGYGLEMITEFLRLNIGNGLEFAGGNGEVKVKLGSGLEFSGSSVVVDTDTIASRSWVSSNFNNYSLPAATAGVRGGIKVGDGLSISGDVLNATGLSKSTQIVGTQGNVLLNNSGFTTIYTNTFSFTGSKLLFVAAEISNSEATDTGIIFKMTIGGTPVSTNTVWFTDIINTHTIIGFAINSGNANVLIEGRTIEDNSHGLNLSSIRVTDIA